MERVKIMNCCGVIVTYNRKELLKENIDSCLTQTRKLDMIYIIDNNSTDGTYIFLNELGYFLKKNIKYVKLEENIGGAGGFYTGVKNAFEDGFDFIVLMDDDGRPFNKFCFENLLNCAEKIKTKSPKMMLNSLVMCDEKRLSFGLGEILTINDIGSQDRINEINPFNGTLVSNELVREIGYPDKNFFIKGDEVDYRTRAKIAKAAVFTVTNSVYYHPSIPHKHKRFLFKTVKVIDESPWKEYYRARNHTYINLKYKNHFKLLHHYLWQIRNIILSSNRTKKIKYFIKGVHDGIHKKMGPTVLP